MLHIPQLVNDKDGIRTPIRFFPSHLPSQQPTLKPHSPHYTRAMETLAGAGIRGRAALRPEDLSKSRELTSTSEAGAQTWAEQPAGSRDPVARPGAPAGWGRPWAPERPYPGERPRFLHPL